MTRFEAHQPAAEVYKHVFPDPHTPLETGMLDTEIIMGTTKNIME